MCVLKATCHTVYFMPSNIVIYFSIYNIEIMTYSLYNITKEGGFIMNATKISGKRIKELRENNHYSQASIAAFLGIDQSMISKIESDQRALTSDMVEKLACLFGVHQSALKQDCSEMPLTCALRSSGITCQDMDVICTINRIALNCNFIDKLLDGAESK